MDNTWTKEFELSKYWDKIMISPSLVEEYNSEFAKQRQYLKIDNYKLSGIIMDIGGGAFGGVFNFLDIGSRRILADPLADIFREKFNKIPENVEIINAYCKDIALPDKSVDVIFCINTLDHCNSVKDFDKSLFNIERILVNNGLLFFMLPIRDNQIEGHFICNNNVPREDILKYFKNYDIITEDWDYFCVYVVGRKR